MSGRAPLHTERLTLRPPVPDDAGWIAREIVHFEVHPMLTAVPRPYGLADAEDWIAANRDLSGVFVIEFGDATVGSVTLENPGWGHELGYWLIRAAWGSGIMTEAAGAALAWHFAASDAEMPSGHVIGNAASRRVLLKLGFSHTEIVRRHSKFHGQEVDVQRMSLTRAAWEASHDR